MIQIGSVGLGVAATTLASSRRPAAFSACAIRFRSATKSASGAENSASISSGTDGSVVSARP